MHEDIKKICDSYDENLSSTDNRFNGIVIIQSIFNNYMTVYDNSFAVKYKDWYFVFSEHEGNAIYHQDDYKIIYCRQRSEIKTILSS